MQKSKYIFSRQCITIFCLLATDIRFRFSEQVVHHKRRNSKLLEDIEQLRQEREFDILDTQNSIYFLNTKLKFDRNQLDRIYEMDSCEDKPMNGENYA